MIASMANRSTAIPPRTLPRIIPVVRADWIFTADAIEVWAGADSDKDNVLETFSVACEGREGREGWAVLPVPAVAVIGTAVISVSSGEEVVSLSIALGVDDETARANTAGEETNLVCDAIKLELVSVDKVASAWARLRGKA